MHAGDVIDDYVVERPLAEGGMAEIFVVRHRVLGSTHALKRLRPECAGRERMRKRFLAEGRVQAQLRHRNIVPVTDLVSNDEHTALIMDLLPGGTLSSRLAQLPTNLSPVEAVAVLGPLLDALAFAHAKGVIHRDIKPDNVLFRDQGWSDPLLSDFGIAKVTDEADIQGTRLKATRAGVTMGTPGYMAPEQIKGSHAVGPTADLFAIGVIAWEMVLGVPPFVGSTEYDLMEKIVLGLRPSLAEVAPGLPAAFREVIERAIATDPRARYQDAASLSEALSESLRGAGEAATRRIPKTADREIALREVLASVPPPATRAPPTLAELTERARAMTRSRAPTVLADEAGPVEVDVEPVPDPVRPSPARHALLPALGATVLLGAAAGLVLLVYPKGQPTPGGPLDPAHDYAGVGGAILRAHRYELLPIVADGVAGVGSAPDEVGRGDDEALLQVQVRRFAIGSTEVTQGLWEAVMGENPVVTGVQDWEGRTSADHLCKQWGVGPELPVWCVTWNEAVAFANRASELDGLVPAYVIEKKTVTWRPDADGYRLPTEAEWEVAARAGSGATFAPAPRGDDLCRHGNVAGWWTAWWIDDLGGPTASPCSDPFTTVAPVAHLEPNAWGLFDTSGNVAEWVWDAYDPGGVAPAPPLERRRTTRTVLRGGTWGSAHAMQRTADRSAGDPTQRSWMVGLRLARSLE